MYNSVVCSTSISWTLDIKRGTHNTIIHYLLITHTYFSFQICIYQTCTHIIVYIIYSVFAILYITYLYIYIILFYFLWLVLLLSFCCTVELLSLLQIPCMCKHTWPIKVSFKSHTGLEWTIPLRPQVFGLLASGSKINSKVLWFKSHLEIVKLVPLRSIHQM